MKAFRIAKSRYAGTIDEMLSGQGAFEHGGRWNFRNTYAVYCSENSSLAALEILANLVRPSTLRAYCILDVDIPDGLIVNSEVPRDVSTQSVGSRMLREHLAIIVWSVVNPLERNVVINPRHPEMDRVNAGRIQPFAFDRRLASGSGYRES